MADIVSMNGIRKSYGTVDALRGFDLAVPRGAIHGFLGRNGAGKTTALKILLGMTHAGSGDARVFGLDARDARTSVEIRRRAAFVSEEKQLDPSMTAAELIRFTASFHPTWRRDLEQRYAGRFAIPLGRKVRALSNGTRTQLALLVALCRGAELLLLDEPTSGLDPAVAEEVLQAVIAHAANEDATVLFSSHHIAEVEQVADRVTIIDRGMNVVSGELDELRASHCRVQLVFSGDAPRTAFEGARVQRSGRVLNVFARSGAEPILEQARGLGAVSSDVFPVTLKEIFLETVAAED